MRTRLANIVPLLHRLNQNVQGTMTVIVRSGREIRLSTLQTNDIADKLQYSLFHMAHRVTNDLGLRDQHLHVSQFQMYTVPNGIRDNCVLPSTTGDRYLQISTKRTGVQGTKEVKKKG